jgi:thiamine monophosphate synthase
VRDSPTGVVVLTDRRLAARPLVEVVAAAVEGGSRWVILRESDLGYAERRALADALRALLPPGHLIVAGPDPLGGNAIHLPAATPVPALVSGEAASWKTGHPETCERPTSWMSGGSQGVGPDGGLLVGRSCHHRGELARLSIEDYVTVSPIHPTATKPGYGPPLTAAGAAALGSPVPWLALGGIDSADRAATCATVGAAGVAVLGAVMRADDPAAAVRDLVGGFDRGTAECDPMTSVTR